MIYRVTTIFLFTVPDEARDFFHDCEVALPRTVTINEGKANEEHSIATLEECFHNEPVLKPCIVLQEIHSP